MNNALLNYNDKYNDNPHGLFWNEHEDGWYNEYIYHHKPVLFSSPVEKIGLIREDFNLKVSLPGVHPSFGTQILATEMSRSCGAMLNGEMILIGGMNRKKKVIISNGLIIVCLIKIHRIDGCQIRQLRISLDFDFWHGVCQTYRFGYEKILFCFGSYPDATSCHI